MDIEAELEECGDCIVMLDRFCGGIELLFRGLGRWLDCVAVVLRGDWLIKWDWCCEVLTFTVGKFGRCWLECDCRCSI